MPYYEEEGVKAPFTKLLDQRPDIKKAWTIVSGQTDWEWGDDILLHGGSQDPPRPTSFWERHVGRLLLAMEIHQGLPISYPEITQQQQDTLGELIYQMRRAGRYSAAWLQEQQSLAAKIHQQFTPLASPARPSRVSSLRQRLAVIVSKPH